MKNKLFFVLFSLMLGFVPCLAFAQWSGPTSTPPTGNISAPLNTSSTAQSKAGGLLLNTGGATDGLIVQSGYVGLGTLSPANPLEVWGLITSTTYETPMITNGPGNTGGYSTGQYNAGYEFTPTTNGQITALSVYPNTTGTFIVRLYDASNNNVLASVTVAASSGSWKTTSITPVSISSGHQYEVAAVASGSGVVGACSGYYSCYGPYNNTTYGHITMEGSVGASTGGTSVPPNQSLGAVMINVDVTFAVTGSSRAASVLTVGPTGDVGIDNASPAYPLDVAGSINSTGSVTATAFNNTSDERLKTNIEPLDGETALSDILQLQGVSYDWKNPSMGTGPQIGLIAQDVQKVFPQIVHTDASTTLESVDYAKLVAPLIEAIKTQQSEIDTLTAEVNALKAEK